VFVFVGFCMNEVPTWRRSDADSEFIAVHRPFTCLQRSIVPQMTQTHLFVLAQFVTAVVCRTKSKMRLMEQRSEQRTLGAG
jgi:hypothetical protein